MNNSDVYHVYVLGLCNYNIIITMITIMLHAVAIHWLLKAKLSTQQLPIYTTNIRHPLIHPMLL